MLAACSQHCIHQTSAFEQLAQCFLPDKWWPNVLIDFILLLPAYSVVSWASEKANVPGMPMGSTKENGYCTDTDMQQRMHACEHVCMCACMAG